MLYDVKSPATSALDGMSKAAGTYGSMMKDIPANRDPGTTAGGALNAGMGGATVGLGLANMGTGFAAVGMSNPVGIGAMAALGIASYLLS